MIKCAEQGRLDSSANVARSNVGPSASTGGPAQTPKQTARDTRLWYMRKLPVATAVAASQINIARAKLGRVPRDTHNDIEFTKGVGRRVFADLNQAA